MTPHYAPPCTEGNDSHARVVRSLRKHPIQDYFKAGIVVTVNTDDPKMFQTSLAEEYRLLEQECGFTRSDIRELILNAIRAAWLPEDRKASLAARFRGSPSWTLEESA